MAGPQFAICSSYEAKHGEWRGYPARRECFNRLALRIRQHEIPRQCAVLLRGLMRCSRHHKKIMVPVLPALFPRENLLCWQQRIVPAEFLKVLKTAAQIKLRIETAKGGFYAPY